MSAERRRLSLALLFSLLIHALLLSLTFGGQGLGLPGFAFPWQARRIEAPDLRVVLAPARDTAGKPAGMPVQAQQQASTEPAADDGVAPRSSVPPMPPSVQASAMGASVTPVEPAPSAIAGAPSAQTPLAAEDSGDVLPVPTPQPAVMAVEQPDAIPVAVLAAPPTPTPATPVAPSASNPETAQPAPPDVGKMARNPAEAEAPERTVAVVKPDPAEQEAQRQEAARQEAARIEAARQEAERQEAARRAAAQEEATRQKLAREEAARAEAQRQEAERLEAARRAMAQQDAQDREIARQEAARAEAARVLAEQEAEARREARLRAIGRQLDAEAAQRNATSAATRAGAKLPLSLSTARRFRLWGRSDPNVELIQYAEAWARKIQLNTPVDTVREVAKRPHTHPMVTVALRSDGSVESLTFVVSSGVAEVDEAIRRIVQGHTPYQVFPPGLAAKYDVIEIRRTWHFDQSIRLD